MTFNVGDRVRCISSYHKRYIEDFGEVYGIVRKLGSLGDQVYIEPEGIPKFGIWDSSWMIHQWELAEAEDFELEFSI